MSQGPGLLQQVFNEQGALLAIFGAMGGAVRSAMVLAVTIYKWS